MSVSTLLPDPSVVALERLISSKTAVTAVLRSTQKAAACPACAGSSSRIHSRYCRSLADLPWQGVAVRLQLHVRKFFCDAPGYPRRVFAERLPTVAAAYARRSTRLADVLTLIGFALGGEAGARIAADLGLGTSPDTLLRRIRLAALAPREAPRVLGIDDFAFRRGHTYGTILVDLERRRPIDLLPDRDASSLAAWLEARPGIEVITRDRAQVYAEAARAGTPDATQVADRWHLLKNLGEAIERMLESRRATLREIARELEQELAAEQPGASANDGRVDGTEPPTSKAKQMSAQRRERRVARYTEVHGLWCDGHSKREIGRRTGLSRKTVRRLLSCDVFPERATVRRPSALDAYEPYLRERWDAGCRNGTQLYDELVARGYQGCAAMVRKFVSRWRPESWRRPGRKTREEESRPREIKVTAPTPRKAMWLITREEPSDDVRRRLTCSPNFGPVGR